MGRCRRSFASVARWSVALIALCLASAPAALAGPGDFFSSFEAGEPQPTWTSTAESGRSSGVSGPTQSGGIPGNQTQNVVAVRASGENPPNEVKENLIDGSPQTKWPGFTRAGRGGFPVSPPGAPV